jgi:hypothetical protein
MKAAAISKTIPNARPRPGQRAASKIDARVLNRAAAVDTDHRRPFLSRGTFKKFGKAMR